MTARQRKFFLREAAGVLAMIATGILITWSGVFCESCRDNPRVFWTIAALTSILWVLLWKGNEYLADYISRRISWLREPFKRFIVGIFAATVYTLAVAVLVPYLFERSSGLNVRSSAVYSFILTTAISLFMHARVFLLNWRAASIEAERYQKESLAAKYESLKNQVNPHFLFNSLNALTNLVYEDKQKAATFIDELSNVYRYVLDSREKEVVSLEEELHFLKAYLYLQEIRFGKKLNVLYQLEGVKTYVAPLALQMLVENCIKHNIVSEEDPLNIFIFTEDRKLVVRNNYQPKRSYGEPSSGVGLENIARRYEILSTGKVEVIKDEQYFTVKLPFLERKPSLT